MTSRKKTIQLIISFVSLIGFSQSKIGIINDKDGFVNVRLDKTIKSEIIGKIIENENFTYFNNNDSNWWIVKTKKGLIGYIHRSRIQFIKKGFLEKGKILDKIATISVHEHLLKDIYIKIIQIKPSTDFYNFSCKGLIRTIKDKKLVDEISYPEIEAVGGNHGITFSKNQNVPNLFIASKFGDYNGEIMIVDLNGKISKFEGGQYFITKNKKYLISTWDSDLSGLTIYDLKNKQIKFKKELDFYLGNWYYKDNIYYAPEWNGEKEINKTYLLDFKNFKLLKSTLKTTNGIKIDEVNQSCNCN
ncbi:SH3 domain-containing protein [uncultured Tenacibaculum sp.]|uniref:SH3 domain-containing protein n=1 Tax=uncultured Tenacibaculum sp. TaxID=174713 RepID=UPI00260AD473|nr:SH3 domain-containing protein [uncultured Tenacibaculum sp.]